MIQPIKKITNTTINIPTPTPVLNISPMASQEVNKNVRQKRIKELIGLKFFMILSFINYPKIIPVVFNRLD